MSAHPITHTPAAPVLPFTRVELDGLAYLIRKAIATGQLTLSCEDLSAAGRELDRGLCLTCADWTAKVGEVLMEGEAGARPAVRMWVAYDDMSRLVESVDALPEA